MIHPEKIDYKALNLKLNQSELHFNHHFKIKTQNKVARLNLTLTPLKKIVKHFDSGYAEMSSHPAARTYYLTYPRIETKGKLQIRNKKYAVSGLSWFDHQKMNLPHNSSVRGWDWFSLILSDGTELMIFILKTKLGTHHLGGTYIDQDNQVINLKLEDIKVKAISQWTSPKSGITYPSGWELSISKLKLSVKVIPCLLNQELDDLKINPITYWEGACDVKGINSGKEIKGQAYVELVGYDNRMRTNLLRKLIN